MITLFSSIKSKVVFYGCNPVFQNEFIIQIMTELHEIDNLKRKVEDAKMKLVTEIKVITKKKNTSIYTSTKNGRHQNILGPSQIHNFGTKTYPRK